MKIPLSYNARSLIQRPVSTAFTALGIALVVAVFIGMLALANGFRSALIRTGSTQNVLMLRRGADWRCRAASTAQSVSIIASSPHVATGGDGQPMVSPEAYIVINLPRHGGGATTWRTWWRAACRTRRSRSAATSRSSTGRRFAVGPERDLRRRELKGRFNNINVGDMLRFANRNWTVVCRFTADGSASSRRSGARTSSSMPVFRGERLPVRHVPSQGPGGIRGGQARRSRRTSGSPWTSHRESDFYAQQSELLGKILESSRS